MRINKYIIFLFSIWIFISACGPDKLTAPEYMEWVANPENGLRRKQELGMVTFIVQYKPTDYMIAKTILKDGKLDENPDSLRQKSTITVFDIHITCESGSIHPYYYNNRNPQAIEQRQRYYHFSIQDDIYAKSGSQEFRPLYCRAEHGALMNNTLTLECGFESIPTSEDISLIINDTQLGSGIVKFNIDKSALSHIPTLKI